MSTPLLRARTALTAAQAGLHELHAVLTTLQREGRAQAVFDYMRNTKQTSLPSLLAALLTYQTTLDLLEAEAFVEEAVLLDFYPVGDFVGTRFADMAWHLGTRRRGEAGADTYPGASPNSRYLVQLDPEDDGLRYGIAYYLPLDPDPEAQRPYGNTAAFRRAFADAPDLFDDYNDVVWFEREDLSIEEAMKLLRAEAPWNSPAAAAERLGFDVLASLPRPLPLLRHENGQAWRADFAPLQVLPLGPSSRPFTVSGDLVLVSAPLATTGRAGDPPDARVWLLCRYLSARQSYLGAAETEREHLKAHDIPEALSIAVVFGRRQDLYEFSHDAPQPLPRVAVRFMERLARRYADEGSGSLAASDLDKLLHDDLPQLNLKPWQEGGFQPLPALPAAPT